MEDRGTVMIYLDYGDRESERKFIKEIIERYDVNTLIGAGILVNNNPYVLEAILFLNFDSRYEEFDQWLLSKKNRRRVVNYFLDDAFALMARKGYSCATFIDSETVDLIMSSANNAVFAFPDRKVVEKLWPTAKPANRNVFLSHSSSNKGAVDLVFSELQKLNVSAWYDRYEIKVGDSITDKINEGLNSADLGVLFLSSDFLNSKSGWPMAEANFFFQKRMKDKSAKFIVVNIDLEHHQIPPLLQDYRYLHIADLHEIAISIKSSLENI